MREFIFELCDDEEFIYLHRHRVIKYTGTYKECFKKVHEEYPDMDVAQVCRKFSDCKLPQPVFDILYGAYDTPENIDAAEKLSDIFGV